MRQWMDMAKNLTMLTQFGLSLITPLLMCLALSWLLYAKAGLGGWIFVPGFFFGMGGSGMVAWKLYLSVTKDEEKKKRKKKASFNSHA